MLRPVQLLDILTFSLTHYSHHDSVIIRLSGQSVLIITNRISFSHPPINVLKTALIESEIPISILTYLLLVNSAKKLRIFINNFKKFYTLFIFPVQYTNYIFLFYPSITLWNVINVTNVRNNLSILWSYRWCASFIKEVNLTPIYLHHVLCSANIGHHTGLPTPLQPI